MLKFIIGFAVIMIAFCLMFKILIIWTYLLDNIDDEYEYCYNCPYGMCMESPKGKHCKKWRENESKNQK